MVTQPNEHASVYRAKELESLEETSEDVDVEPDPDESAVSFGVVEQAAKKNTKSAPVKNFITI